jgi:Uma2 family endonuclease
MSTITVSQPTLSQTPRVPPEIYRMNVDEYERIVDGLDDPRVELIDGYLVKRTDMKPPHVLVTERLRRRLDRIVPEAWFVREEKPVRIPEFDEPFPDVSVVRGDPETYDDHHTGPADAALLIEVSESSLDRDQGEKWAAYGRGGIPVYWIVNLVDRRVEVYTDPGPAGYASREVFQPGQDVPVIIAGVEVGRVAVADILPRQQP